MLNMRILPLTIMALFFLPHLSVRSANAKEQKTGALISAGYLMELCARGSDGKEKIEGAHIACQSYIAGIIDYHNLLQSMGTSPNVNICVPKTAKLKDLQDIVYVYLKGNSHHDAFIAAPAVNLALFESFPCKSKHKSKK